MKNSTKSKLLAVMLLPALLGGCASKAVPTVKANIGNPQIKDMYVVDGGGGGGSSSNYQSTGYPSVYGYETHVTTLLKSMIGGNLTDLCQSELLSRHWSEDLRQQYQHDCRLDGFCEDQRHVALCRFC
jgi:hypothetical protein